MTKEEFLRGYMLLVVQPWGKRYHLDSQEGQLQSELYYRNVSWASAEAWAHVSEVYAQGEKWPPLFDLKQALRHHMPRRIALPAPAQGVSCAMPEEVRKRINDVLERAAKPMAEGPMIKPERLLSGIEADFKATGMLSRCPKCQDEREIVVCWCHKEYCRPCLIEHVQGCQPALAVQRI